MSRSQSASTCIETLTATADLEMYRRLGIPPEVLLEEAGVVRVSNDEARTYVRNTRPHEAVTIRASSTSTSTPLRVARTGARVRRDKVLKSRTAKKRTSTSRRSYGDKKELPVQPSPGACQASALTLKRSSCSSNPRSQRSHSKSPRAPPRTQIARGRNGRLLRLEERSHRQDGECAWRACRCGWPDSRPRPLKRAQGHRRLRLECRAQPESTRRAKRVGARAEEPRLRSARSQAAG